MAPVDISEYVRELVDAAPPLTEEQTRKLRAIMYDHDNEVRRTNMTAGEWAGMERVAQCLPQTVEDPSALARIAAMIVQKRGGHERPEETEELAPVEETEAIRRLRELRGEDDQ